MCAESANRNDASAAELLRRFALDLRWSWHHGADELWKQLDATLWEQTGNPWMVLKSASPQGIARALADPDFCEIFERLKRTAESDAQAPAWFQQAHPDSQLAQVAYFSMEFMLSEALPIYAGGLGNVAGDQLKAASDLGIPIVGVGLLYSQGYFRQVINHDGAQQALFPYNDPDQLPVTPLRKPDGEWLRLEIKIHADSLWLRSWEVKVGRLHLFLLDSNDIANQPAQRGITSELYGGGPELRLQQELILGIGGWRLLQALGLRPDVCHLNEGHAALAILERARSCMEESGVSFETALATTRAGNVFTTHTAVAAGFDRFAPALIKQYLESYANSSLHISLQQLLALGRENPSDDLERFNMANLAMRGCALINGVSRLHGEVSRRIFLPLFPRWPAAEVPVDHITNGVHSPSWDSMSADALWTDRCGKDRWLGTLHAVAERIRSAPDSAIWQCRMAGRKSLVEYARRRLAAQLAASGGSAEETANARQLFNPELLTLGFARRFATYKRPNLLLHDPERLARLLNDSERPAQLIIAGKAHPEDMPGQLMIQEWVQFVRRYDIRPRAIFLSDYDMSMTAQLVAGVDVWVNTPRRPWEACGTSGMKVLVNGGLNLSELDGWWAEAFAPTFGWALGDGGEHGEDPGLDAAEAGQLYELLENQVIPEFYSRDGTNVPRAWVGRIRESMASLTPVYSANRSVREYTERCYLPAAAAYRSRAQNKAALGAQISDWRRALELGWPTLRFGRVTIDTRGDRHYFDAEVDLGSLTRSAVRVELYADALADVNPFRQEMECHSCADHGMLAYSASVPAVRAADDYTPRIIPNHPDVNVPLEAPLVLWQR
ncbi:MAG: alpha-glucan family phosphorylase [Steroidobacteraceae bacterium]